jgi:hypothetical protein
MSMALPKGSVYTEFFRYQQIRLFESGLIRQQMSPAETACDANGDSFSSLGMDKACSAFIFLAACYVASIFIGIAEYLNVFAAIYT